ncbi:hypothetical protein [Sphingobium sp. Z007]|nr:hypothetical protein [Sphingobium sp. Z007]
MTDDEQADYLDSLTDQERAELGLSPRLPRYVPRRAPVWQTTDAEAEHLDQPHFKDSFSRVRWFAAQAYRQAAQLAEIYGDCGEASRLRMEASAMDMMVEADLLIDTLQKS